MRISIQDENVGSEFALARLEHAQRTGRPVPRSLRGVVVTIRPVRRAPSVMREEALEKAAERAGESNV